MIIMTDSGQIDGVGLIFELTDEQLERVKNDNKYLFDKEFLKSCYTAKGDNAHVFFLCNQGDSRRIMKNLYRLAHRFKTVSWWDREIDKFYLIRR